MAQSPIMNKWEHRIDSFIKTDMIPEIEAKRFLKEHLSELISDCEVLLKEDGEMSVGKFVAHLIDYAIEAQKKNNKRFPSHSFVGNPKCCPNLSYFDNLRDRDLGSEELIPYEGSFGKWPNSKNN